MFDQMAVSGWLREFVRKLQAEFRGRLVFVGHHGSWARGEGVEGSDIDTMVLLDDLTASDLATYRRIIASMPEGGIGASGLLNSVAELRALPRRCLMQYFYGCQVLHGSLVGTVEKPTADELLEQVRSCAWDHMQDARHYLLYPHDLAAKVHALHYPFNACSYALQSWVLARTGIFYPRRVDLRPHLTDPDDCSLLDVVSEWRQSSDDRERRPLYYIELLERWCRGMLARVSLD